MDHKKKCEGESERRRISRDFQCKLTSVSNFFSPPFDDPMRNTSSVCYVWLRHSSIPCPLNLNSLSIVLIRIGDSMKEDISVKVSSQ